MSALTDAEAWAQGIIRRTPGECVLLDCDDRADAGLHCRAHWDELLARDVAIEARQPAEYLARQLVEARRCREFVVEQMRGDHGGGFGSCCGHALIVHHAGGCTGLRHVGLIDFAPCKCLKWEARS